MPLPNPTCGCQECEGVLVTSLTAPGCVTDAPTETTVRFYQRDGTTRLLEETTTTYTVYNSDPTIGDPAIEAGTYVRFKRIGGILQFSYIGCSDALLDCSSSSSSGGA